MNIKLKLFTYLILISVSSLSFTDDTDGDGIDNSLDNHSIISTDDSVTFDNLPTSISSGKNMLSSFSSFSSTQAVNETPVATDVYAAMLMNTSGENRSVSTTFGLIGSAENGTTLTFELLTAPQYGSLADPNDSDRIISSFPHVIAAEKLSYMPPENFSGVISFDFRVSDGVNVSASAVATVTVFDKYSSGSRKIGGSIDPVLSGSLYSESNGQTVAVDISDDGQTIAIGEPNYEDGRGRVRIFTLSGGDWEQLGVDIQINGSCLIEAQLFGFSVNLSSDGRSVAIGAPGKRFDCNRKPTGYAYLYSFELMQIGDQYLPYWRGDSSVFGNIGSFLGHAVSISSDGRTYAASSRDGLVRLVNDNGRRDINYGSSSIAASTGPSLSLDDNGSTVAIGSQRRVSDNNGDGHVGVFRLLDNEWVVLGQFMEGETDANGFGASISLSGDGRSIAVSAPRAKVSDLFGAGHVRVFDFNGEEWLQRGISLGGEASRGSDVACCLSVSLSSDGQAVAAGWYWVTLANNNNKGNGVARVYDWLNSEWLQRGQDIDAQSVYARTYRHEVYVSLSADAQTMSVSVPVSHDGNKGRIQILDLTDSAPKIFGNPKNLAMVGQLYAFSPEVEDPDPAQAHVFSVTSNNGDLPPWLSFDESTGVLEGIPSSSDIGLISDISLQVTDSLFDDVLGNFNIEVIDADTEAPVITTSNILSSVDEGETALGTVTANESVTWSIVGSSISISNSGAVTLDDAADYETATSHSFTITATDSSGNAASTELLTVTVIDADEEAPVITTSNILSSVDEGETALGTVTANESVTWSIVGSGISISNSGAVTLDDAADYETATSHSFTITATDSSGNAASTELLTVTVIDADENTPVKTVDFTSAITQLNMTANGDQINPSISSLPGNKFAMIWSDRAGNDGDRGGIFGGIYDEKLALISSEFVVNTLTTDWQSKSNIASASNGNFMAIWHQANGFVEGQLFNISGEKLGNQFTIQEGYNGLSDVVADATGNFWVVSTGGGIGYINKYSNTGELLLDSKVYQSEAVAYEPVITVLTDSRILVSWYDGQNTAGSDIYGQFVTSAGELEGIPFIINTTLAENQSKQAIAGLVSGGFVVTWQSLMQDGDLAGIYARVFDESGVGGEEIAVNTETIGNQVWSHVTARSDGGFVVGWVDAKAPQQVYLQSYAENGLTQGTNRVVSIDDIKTINNSEKIEFTELSDGSLVAVWDAWNGSRNIFGRTFEVKAIIETLEDSDGDGVNDYEDPFPNNSLYSVDSDSDGMPDEWETRYGLDPNDASDATSDQDNDGVTAIDEFLAGTIPSGSLDIDGNENYDALTDGLLLLRGMFGLDGSALVTGTVASDATYTESVDIESRIATLGDLADIDGNGDIDALTDGLLALRYLFGLQGDTLINGVIASDATRKTAEEVEAHLETLMPSL